MGLPHTNYAFISYRHDDNKAEGREWATWLQDAIEQFEVPEDLVGTRNELGETIPKRIQSVFRDETDLPADANLSDAIRRALSDSGSLIVLCSPGAVQSRHVAEEIEYFKELGRADRILGAVIEGEPHASWDETKRSRGFSPDAECLPAPLRGLYDDKGNGTEQHTDPLYVDFRNHISPKQQIGWTDALHYRNHLLEKGDITGELVEQKVRDFLVNRDLMVLKIIAAILGIPLRELTDRNKKVGQAILEKSALRPLLEDFQWTGASVPAPMPDEKWSLLSELTTIYPKEEPPKAVKFFKDLLMKEEQSAEIWSAHWSIDSSKNSDNIIALTVVKSTGQKSATRAIVGKPKSYFGLPGFASRHGGRFHSMPDASEVGYIMKFVPEGPRSKNYIIATTRSLSFWDNVNLYAYEFRADGTVKGYSSYKRDSEDIWAQFAVNDDDHWNGDIIHDSHQFVAPSPDGNYVAYRFGVLIHGNGKDDEWKIAVLKMHEFRPEILYEFPYEYGAKGSTGDVFWSNTSNYFIVCGGAGYQPRLVDVQGKSSRLFLDEDGETKHFGKIAWHPTKDIVASYRYQTIETNSTSTGTSPPTKGWIQITDVASGSELLRKQMPHGGETTFLAWSPDGRYIAITGFGNSVLLWDLEKNLFRTLFRSEKETTHIYFSPDSQRLAVQGGFDREIISIWDHEYGDQLAKFEGSFECFGGSVWHVEGDRIAYQADNYSVHVRKLEI